jgi:4a-hydroxytetrahydrobiopterin dehydratase
MELLNAHCCEVSEAERIATISAQKEYLDLLDAEWKIEQDTQILSRLFRLKDYSEVMLLANFVASLSYRENHHPRMTLEYNTAKIEYTTHSAHGLSLNDFICAARIDHFLEAAD